MTPSMPLLALVAALAATVSIDAVAAQVEVKCETRSNRSKASVDGENLARGQYSAVLISGPNTAQSPYEASVGDEVEFDFDSNRRDIRQGATPISQDFIVGNTATGQIIDAAGNVVAQDTATCRRK